MCRAGRRATLSLNMAKGMVDFRQFGVIVRPGGVGTRSGSDCYSDDLKPSFGRYVGLGRSVIGGVRRNRAILGRFKASVLWRSF